MRETKMDKAEELAEIYKDIFEKLMDLVLEKNKELNLTAIKDKEAFWQKHIIDSLKIFEINAIREMCVNNAGNNFQVNIIDVGTGGGFPGLPIAIICKNHFGKKEYKMGFKITLVDSTRKKIDAVSTFIDKLGLNNSKAVWARVEDLTAKPEYKIEYKNKHDLVIARSVAFLPDLILKTKDLVKPGGILAFYKNDHKEELMKGIDLAKKYNISFLNETTYKLINEEDSRKIYTFKRLV